MVAGVVTVMEPMNLVFPRILEDIEVTMGLSMISESTDTGGVQATSMKNLLGFGFYITLAMV